MSELERLAALRRYNILDTEAEQVYDDIALLAAEICEVPIALISLVEQDRQWFKSIVGLAIQETPRAISFCAHTLQGNEQVTLIEDARVDPRFAGNPFVLGDPNIRFYAGAPLRTPDGYNLGSLCVIDRTPRKLSPKKVAALEALARQVMSQLDLRVKAVEVERASTALRQTEKLAAVGRLAASISHEINNPLQAATNLLYMADGAMKLEDSKTFLNQAQEELGRITHVVTQTLRFHKQSEAASPTELREIVESVLTLYRMRLRRRGVRVRFIDESTTPLVCYAADLRQVIANLVSNAMDALGESGEITVRIKNAINCMILTVADNGSGMSQETRSRLFEAFYSTKGIMGNGLGMWVSKEILEKHHAKIITRSSQRPGASGTVFRIEFPLDALI